MFEERYLIAACSIFVLCAIYFSFRASIVRGASRRDHWQGWQVLTVWLLVLPKPLLLLPIQGGF